VNAFITGLNPTGSALDYSTYLGGKGGAGGFGIATDGSKIVYVTGLAGSGFPTTTGAFQTTYGGNTDAFITALYPQTATTTTLSSSPNPSTYGTAVTFTAVVNSGVGAPPNGETVSFMKGKTVLGSGTLNAGSATFTTSSLKKGTTSVKAVYGGDSDFATSTSNAVKQVVEKAVE
jgi:hypothetical protein